LFYIKIKGERGRLKMWTYTSYILWKYFEKIAAKSDELKFSELCDFIFNTLWRKQGVVFHDGVKDLYLDLEYLQKIGILEISENESLDKVRIKVKDQEKLREVAKVVESSPDVMKLDILREYVERINRAIECVVV
jgi:hypothetical protein